VTREQLARVSVDPEICFGKPCIKGHRIWDLIIPPREQARIAILRLPGEVMRKALRQGCQTVIRALREGDIVGKLWVVQPGRIREDQDPDT